MQDGTGSKSDVPPDSRSLQRAGLDIDMPVFRQDAYLIQIVIGDVQCRAVNRKVGVPVIANINILGGMPVGRGAPPDAVGDRIDTGSFSLRRVVPERVLLMKPVFGNLRYPLEKPTGKESRDGIIGRG